MIGVDALISSGFVFNIMKYSEKLKSPKWQRKRLEILNRDNFTCLLCGDTETELQIHHLKYTGYNPEDAPNEDLETLCKDCHSIKTLYNDSKLIKSYKKNDVLLAINSENSIIVFYKMESGKYEYIIGFLQEGILLNMINEVKDKFWKNK